MRRYFVGALRLYDPTDPEALPVTANLARRVVTRNAGHASTRMSGRAAQVQSRYRCAVVGPVRGGALPEQLVGRELTVKDVALGQPDDRLELRRNERLDVDDLGREARSHRVDDIEGRPGE